MALNFIVRKQAAHAEIWRESVHLNGDESEGLRAMDEDKAGACVSRSEGQDLDMQKECAQSHEG